MVCAPSITRSITDDNVQRLYYVISKCAGKKDWAVDAEHKGTPTVAVEISDASKEEKDRSSGSTGIKSTYFSPLRFMRGYYIVISDEIQYACS